MFHASPPFLTSLQWPLNDLSATKMRKGAEHMKKDALTDFCVPFMGKVSEQQHPWQVPETVQRQKKPHVWEISAKRDLPGFLCAVDAQAG